MTSDSKLLKYDENTIFGITTWKGLSEVSDKNEIKELLDLNSSKYYHLDVVDAMSKLAQVGSLLQLSYAASKGFNCSQFVIKILSRYQSLIKDSVIASETFVNCSIRSIALHKTAWKLFDKKKVDSGIKLLSKCGDLATKLELAAEDLVKKSQALVNMAEEALIEATKDESVKEEQKQEIKRKLNEVKELQVSLETNLNDLKEDIAENKRQEEKYAKLADKTRQQQFMLNCIGAIAQPIVAGISAYKSPFGGLLNNNNNDNNNNNNNNNDNNDNEEKDNSNVKEKENNLKKEHEKDVKNIDNEIDEIEKKILELNKKLKNTTKEEEKSDIQLDIEFEEKKLQRKKDSKEKLSKGYKEMLSNLDNQLDKRATSLEDKESDYANKVFELQKNKREVNANLQKSLKQLEHLNIESNDLDAAIESLNIVITSLGQIKTTFENTRLFWNSVKVNCNQIKDNTEIIVLMNDEDLIDDVKELSKETLFDWFTLAYINLIAANTVRTTDSKVDKIMTNLPNKKEAKELVKKLSDEMLQDINKEIEESEKQMKQMEEIKSKNKN